MSPPPFSCDISLFTSRKKNTPETNLGGFPKIGLIWKRPPRFFFCWGILKMLCPSSMLFTALRFLVLKTGEEFRLTNLMKVGWSFLLCVYSAGQVALLCASSNFPPIFLKTTRSQINQFYSFNQIRSSLESKWNAVTILVKKEQIFWQYCYNE